MWCDNIFYYLIQKTFYFTNRHQHSNELWVYSI